MFGWHPSVSKECRTRLQLMAIREQLMIFLGF
jgi:hypothetical protein